MPNPYAKLPAGVPARTGVKSMVPTSSTAAKPPASKLGHGRRRMFENRDLTGFGVKVEPGRIALVLPYPPSANDYWRTTKGGKVFVSTDAKRYKADLKSLCHALTPFKGPLKVTAIVYRPIKARDLKNCEKVLSDALNGLAWDDDGQVVESHWYLRDDKHRPRVVVDVRPVGVLAF